MNPVHTRRGLANRSAASLPSLWREPLAMVGLPSAPVWAAAYWSSPGPIGTGAASLIETVVGWSAQSLTGS